MTSPTYDIAVIGGGIIGLSTAMALTSGQSLSLVVLEAEKGLASHQTGNNSGVIHSGLYYKPGSLKARYCVEGQKAMYRFCQEHGIAHEQCGKVVVATSEREDPGPRTRSKSAAVLTACRTSNASAPRRSRNTSRT